MDPYYNENSYFQNEYILEEQYISYNEDNYDYGNNWEVQGWDGGIEIGPEYEEMGHGFKVEERFGEGVGIREEIGREWEEEGRGKGWEYEWDEPGQVHQDYQPEMQADEEIGYEVPYGGSTPPWEHSYHTLDTPFVDDMYTEPTQWVYGEPEADHQLGTQIEDEREPYEPYEEPTKALEGPHFTLDAPFANYMYTAPSQWTYQSPPLSPLLQPETVANHPYPVAPTFHQSTWHIHTPPTRYLNPPR